MSSGLQRRRGAKNSEPERAVDQADIADRKTLNLPLFTLMEEVLLLGLKDKEGYLSFWNDNISYALRGCILLELALRKKISLVNDPARRRFELSERLVEVIDTEPTGEVLLDEALQIMKNDGGNLSVSYWIDLLSGETWNIAKISYQLKQVRERLAKGLVDKGILRTERKNFFLFDMPTHPVADPTAKEHIKARVVALLSSRTVDIDAYACDHFGKEVSFKYMRSVALICAAYAANVLENVFPMVLSGRDEAFARADELLAIFGDHPFNLTERSPLGIGTNLGEEVQAEIEACGGDELQMELFAAVVSVFARMDSLL